MIDPEELRALDGAVTAALRTRDVSGLDLLGFGEISIVVGWPRGEPAFACKRLPPFRHRAAFERYAACVRAYVDALRDAGVGVVETALPSVPQADGRVVGYHVQPFVAAGALGTEVLRAASPDAAHPLVVAIVDAVTTVTTERLGVDAQLSNWVWRDGQAENFDLTTPLMLDEHLRPVFEFEPFLRSLPAVARPITSREMRSFMNRYLDPRTCLVDLVSNLPKEGLGAWVPAVLGAANARLDRPVTIAEAEAFHRQDVKLWPLVLRLQRIEAWWQQRVRRRPYDFLLRERSTYETAADV
ncbi:MAG: DUF6206 family protein [Acidimicrobiia bacterium]